MLGWINDPKNTLPISRIVPGRDQEALDGILREIQKSLASADSSTPLPVQIGVVGQRRAAGRYPNDKDEKPAGIEVLTRIIVDDEVNGRSQVAPDAVYAYLDRNFPKEAISLDFMMLQQAKKMMDVADKNGIGIVLNITQSLLDSPEHLQEFCKQIKEAYPHAHLTVEAPEYYTPQDTGRGITFYGLPDKSVKIIKDNGFYIAHNTISLADGSNEDRSLLQLSAISQDLDAVNISVERGMQEQLKKLDVERLIEQKNPQDILKTMESEAPDVFKTIKRLIAIREGAKDAFSSKVLVVTRGDEDDAASKLLRILDALELTPNSGNIHLMNFGVHKPDEQPALIAEEEKKAKAVNTVRTIYKSHNHASFTAIEAHFGKDRGPDLNSPEDFARARAHDVGQALGLTKDEVDQVIEMS